MRKTQSTLARSFKLEKQEDDALSDILEYIGVIREAQLAARETTLKEIRQNITEWLQFDDFKLRARLQTFISAN